VDENLVSNDAFGFSDHQLRAGATALVDIVQRHLPRQVTAEGMALEDWRLAGPAIVVRSAGTLQSMLDLLDGLRSTDAVVLLRSLYEGVLVFAWVVLDPQHNLPRWVKKTCKEALRGDDEWMQIGKPTLDPENRSYCQSKADDALTKEPPSRPDMATAVDTHWGNHYPVFTPFEGEVT